MIQQPPVRWISVFLLAAILFFSYKCLVITESRAIGDNPFAEYQSNTEHGHSEDCQAECLGDEIWDYFSKFKEIIPESVMTAKPQVDSGNLCSRRSSARGLHQRVVSFSFWGEMKTAYWEGIVANLGE